jgi:beta-glucanase (GH16 family)
MSSRTLFLLLALWLVPTVTCGQGGHASSPVTPTPVPGGTGAWTLVFADEFDHAGSLDGSKWGYELGYIRNGEKQFYTSRPENVRIEDGTLVIEARKEPWQGFGYTSASVNTMGRFQFTYGRVEVRAKIPTGAGTWPAAWMLGVNRSEVGWPTCGEIDIMENVGFDPRRIVGTIHTAAYNHTKGTQKSANVELQAPWEDFHLYAMEWYPDHLDIFVDGQKYFTFTNDGSDDTKTWPFNKPQYLLLNLAIGGSWGGQQGIDDTTFPHRYVIDYVRIYQQQ